MKESKTLKLSLIFQSFAPLFVLLLIKHFPMTKVANFINSHGKDRALLYINGDNIVTICCLVWLLATVIIALGFRSIQFKNFKSNGEIIEIIDTKKDYGATFLVTFVFPLLVDDVETIRGFILFAAMLFLVLGLLIKSDLYYQNPILMLLGYRCFEFKFINPSDDKIKKDATYVGITHGKAIIPSKSIKRKFISDDVFMIFNE